MSAVKTYDPSQVIVTIGGYILSGFAEGTKVLVSYNEDAWSMQIGVDGEGTRSKSNNRSATITVSLMQSSDSNQSLTALYELDRLTNGGAVPLLIKDASSNGTLHASETAWIAKLPDSEYGVEATAREWVIHTNALVSNLAGN